MLARFRKRIGFARLLTLLILLGSAFGGFSNARASVTAPLSASINPLTALVESATGSFYGACFFDPSVDYGAIFQMDAKGDITTLVELNGGDGSAPDELTLGEDGNVYGTTLYGGSLPGYQDGSGTVFQLVADGTASKLTTLWTFTGGNDGAQPNGPLVAQGGNFYGAANAGGSNSNGVIYMVAPSGTNSTLTTLWSFTGGADGSAPVSLTPSSRPGTFYGLASGGGAGFGTVFQLVADGTASTLQPIFTFDNANGNSPEGALVLGANGNYYGMTTGGGSNGAGTVFEITTSGSLTTLVNFKRSNGAEPSGSLLLASDGNFYGTTIVGGAFDGGTIFRMTPAGKLTTLLSFRPTFGKVWEPNSGLIEASGTSPLTLYGQASESGKYGNGCIFNATVKGSQASALDLVDFQNEFDEAPTARTIPAVHVTNHSAVIEAIVDPNALAGSAQFYYSTSNAASDMLLSTGSTTNAIYFGDRTNGFPTAAALTGLQENTTYYFQIAASNGLQNGDLGSILQFTTLGPPMIAYNAPSFSVGTGFTNLSGTVNPEGAETSAYIDYGSTDKYGKSSKFILGDAIMNEPVSLNLKLDSGSTYHYRIQATNAYGTVRGDDQTITAQ